MKLCRKCGLTKPESEFHYRNKAKGVLYSYCKDCNSAGAKTWRAANPEKTREAHRRDGLIRRNGITPEQYEQLLTAQGGVCAICGEAPADARRLDVDHDTTCCPGPKRWGGKNKNIRQETCGDCVRGLLCNRCNRGLGQLHDGDLEIMRRAVAYIETYQASR